jgi:hypothetical protein
LPPEATPFFGTGRDGALRQHAVAAVIGEHGGQFAFRASIFLWFALASRGKMTQRAVSLTKPFGAVRTYSSASFTRMGRVAVGYAGGAAEEQGRPVFFRQFKSLPDHIVCLLRGEGFKQGTLEKAAKCRVSCSVWEEMGPGSSAQG